jgi:hypothetical protein
MMHGFGDSMTNLRRPMTMRNHIAFSTTSTKLLSEVIALAALQWVISSYSCNRGRHKGPARALWPALRDHSLPQSTSNRSQHSLGKPRFLMLPQPNHRYILLRPVTSTTAEAYRQVVLGRSRHPAHTRPLLGLPRVKPETMESSDHRIERFRMRVR